MIDLQSLEKIQTSHEALRSELIEEAKNASLETLPEIVKGEQFQRLLELTIKDTESAKMITTRLVDSLNENTRYLNLLDPIQLRNSVLRNIQFPTNVREGRQLEMQSLRLVILELVDQRRRLTTPKVVTIPSKKIRSI